MGRGIKVDDTLEARVGVALQCLRQLTTGLIVQHDGRAIWDKKVGVKCLTEPRERTPEQTGLTHDGDLAACARTFCCRLTSLMLDVASVPG